MLFLRIDEQVGEVGGAPLEEFLRTDSCDGAAETLKAFSACGTSVQTISGEPRLTRRGRDEGEATTWGKTGDGRERREREEPTPELATSALVYLPAIPSWLPLWGLLSPTDAVSGGGDEVSNMGGSGNSTSDTALSSSAKQTAESDTGSRDEPVFGTAGRGSFAADGKHGHEGGQDEGGQKAGVQDALSTLSTGLGRLAVTDREGSGGRGRKGAVRLVQTVASPLVPYRYAAVLHFWDVDDAASFVERFNGLSLPDRAVMKALYLSGVEVVAAGSSGRGEGGDVSVGGGKLEAVNLNRGDGELSTLRRRKRRSLSEGVSSAITEAATAAASLRGGNGSEEFKSSWSGGMGSGSDVGPNAALEGKGPPNPIPSGDPGDASVYSFGAADVRRRGRGIARSMTAEAAAGDPLSGVRGRRDGYGSRLRERRSESASPSPPVRETEAEETKGRGGGGGGGGGNAWRRGAAFRETSDSLSPPPGLQAGEVFMALSGGDSAGERHRAELVWGEGAGSAVRISHSHDLKGGGGGGGGVGGTGLSRQIELPPCPVCFDRLDPAVSGIPAARARPGARISGSGSGGDTGVAVGIASSAARCNHRECRFQGEAPVGKGKPAVRADEAASSAPQLKGSDRDVGDCCCGSDAEPFGRDTGCTTHDERGSQRERASASEAWATSAHAEESRGPRWEGESAKERGARPHDERGAVGGTHGGGSGGPALNTVIWKGSTCRVCRSLNVALEGAPDEMCCETCRIAHNLWICMVCGHIGCGRYTKEHAKEHFCLSGHSYSLELSTGRVWDYTGDCYAHRALRGHLASSSSSSSAHERGAIGRNEYGHNGRRESQDRSSASASQGGAKGAGGAAAAGAGRGARDGSPPLYSEGQHEAFDEQGDPSSLKVAVVSREYEALVARQLQEQQRYFEDLIATAIAADAEANAPTEEVLTDEERREVAELRQAVEGLSDKYDAILGSLREDEETARRVRSENRGLVAEQRHQKQEEARLIEEARQTKRQCEEQMAELEGQMQDLLFFLKAQEEVKSDPRREELVGGSVVMGEGSAGPSSSGHGRGGTKETERERLARRLKERSHSRRVGTKGAKPGR